MSRQRQISPSFFLDADVAALPPLARILFAGLWTLADRAGRLEDRPDRIKQLILPYDDCDIVGLLRLLAAKPGRFIHRYRAEGRRYVEIRNFGRYQHPHPKEPESKIPSFSKSSRINGAGELHGEQRKATASREITDHAGRIFRTFGYSGPSIPSAPPTGKPGNGAGDVEIPLAERKAKWDELHRANPGKSTKSLASQFASWLSDREKELRA